MDKGTLSASLNLILQSRDSVSIQSGIEAKKKILDLTDDKNLLSGILIDKLIEFDNDLMDLKRYQYKHIQTQKHKNATRSQSI